MESLPQKPEVDASLMFLQKLDEEHVLSKNPRFSQPSFASSEAGSSSAVDHLNAADRKRKRMVASSPWQYEADKRVKIASGDRDVVVARIAQPSRGDLSQRVPGEVWHHIFSMVPPLSLGKLMRVNRLFHRYLDPASPFKVSAPNFDLPSSLPKLSPNGIWRASRRSHWRNMPSPLSGKSELDMWRFACSRSCQFCGQLDETDYAGIPLPWSHGPGKDTVSPIFQFFVTSCGQCLIENSVTEVDLLLSASQSSCIAAAAPMVFLTADLNVVARQTMRHTPMPTSVQLTKVFWPAQLESLQADLEDAKRLGAAAVEEWVKGLESRGAEAVRDASRWDSWYLSGGVGEMRKRSSSILIPSSSTAIPSAPHVESRQSQGKAREIKFKRRADIEARAAQLHPPILPDVLHKLRVFQVASKIDTPLDDKEWEMLKLLLLDQRDKAKQGGRRAVPKKQGTHVYPTRSKAADIKAPELQVQVHADSTIRSELSKFADQIINGQWNKGRTIKKKSCASFAAQVVTYVREQYYAKHSKVQQSSMRSLTLDDMRWIFARKIAPLTDPHGKELFACKKCPASTLYAFERVIQHYWWTHSGGEGGLSSPWNTEWTAKLPFRPAPAAEGRSVKRIPEAGCLTLKERIVTLAKEVASAWGALTSVKNIPTSVRVSAVIYFVAKRYQELYSEPAPVELLFTGKMHNVLVVEACLACRICKQQPGKENDKVFKLPGLAHHFQKTHGHDDWPVGMIWLPSLSLPQDVRAAIRKNRRAFRLISDALPWLLEDKEMSQSGPVSLQSQQRSLGADEEASDAITGPLTHLSPAERPGETPHLLPASAVYSTPDVAQRQLAYRANTGHRPSIDGTGLGFQEAPDRALAQYRAEGIEERDGAILEAAHVSSRSVQPRHATLEPRSYAETYYVYREHEPHTREPQLRYPYYPAMERQRQRSHGAVEVRHQSRHPYTTRYYDSPMPSTTAYHYAEPIPSYDRYDIVDVRNLPHEYYVQQPIAPPRQRTTPMGIISTIPAGNYMDTALAPRAYSAYPSRHQLAEEASRKIEYASE